MALPNRAVSRGVILLCAGLFTMISGCGSPPRNEARGSRAQAASVSASGSFSSSTISPHAQRPTNVEGGDTSTIFAKANSEIDSELGGHALGRIGLTSTTVLLGHATEAVYLEYEVERPVEPLTDIARSLSANVE
jgi:hypothetical protein